MAGVAYASLSNDSAYQVSAFTVDRAYIKEDTLFNLPMVAFEEVETIFSPDEYKMVVSISFRRVNKLRAEKFYQAKAKGYQLISHISSKTTSPSNLVIGENSRIGSNCTLGPFVKIGDNVVVASGCIIGHHTVIKDHCFLAAGVVVAGSVTIEPYCFIGANATIRDRLTIAAECVIGAGSVILEDTQEKGVYMAKPAEKLPITSDKLPLG